MRNRPALSIVEAAYHLGSDREQWLHGIAEAARSLADQDLGVVVAEYAPAPGAFSMVAHTVAPARDDLAQAFLEVDAQGRENPHAAPTLHTTTLCQSTSEAMLGFGLGPEMLDAVYAPRLHPLGMRDSFNVQGADVSGHALCIMAMRSRQTSVPSAVRPVWQRVAVHLAAALRLRRALSDPAPALALDSADAIFDESGRKLLHVFPTAGERVLDNLRSAARAVERAQSPRLCDDAPRALELWQGLFSGRWSLADVFDSDGRRFFVAHANEPAVADDFRLTRRERQAVLLLVSGHSDPLAAYALGIARSTFRAHLRRAMRKLGVGSRVQLVELAHSLAPESAARR